MRDPAKATTSATEHRPAEHRAPSSSGTAQIDAPADLSVRPSPSSDDDGLDIHLGPRATALVRWSFPCGLAALVLLATIGRRGRFYDDYFLQFRSPVDGTIEWERAGSFLSHFGRPLHFLLTPSLQTLLWNHHAIYRLLGMLVHAGAALLLYKFLRRLSIDRRAAMGGSLLFLVFPLSHEVILWSTSLVISIATCLMLVLMLLMHRIALATERFPIKTIALVFVVSFTIPCFYEQPTGILFALPVFFLAVRPAGEGLRRFAPRAVLAMGASGAAALLYAALKLLTANAATRGGADSIVSLSELPARLAHFAGMVKRSVNDQLVGTMGASVSTGLSALNNPMHLASSVLLLAVAGIWGVWWMRYRDRDQKPASSHPRIRLFWVLAFAVVAFAGLWMPAAIIRKQTIVIRLWYGPTVGLGLLLGCLIHLALRVRGSIAVVPRAVTLASVLAISTVGGLALLGWQENHVARYNANRDQSLLLKSLIPEPPMDAVFLCLQDQSTPLSTGNRMFDGVLVGWTWVPWVSNPIIRDTYDREDVAFVPDNPWRPKELVEISRDGFNFIASFPGLGSRVLPNNQTPILWSNTFPFIIESDGTIRLVDRLYIESLVGEDILVDLPHVRASAEPGSLFTDFVLREWGRAAGIPDGFQAIEHWRLMRGDPPRREAKARNWTLWNQKYDFISMDLHPAWPAPEAISTGLPPSPTPRRAVFRATIPPRLTLPLWRTGPQLLSFRLEGQSEPLATLEISADRIEREKRWLPVVVVIPPMDKPGRLIVEMSDTQPGGPALAIMLTRGIIEIAPEQTPTGG